MIRDGYETLEELGAIDEKGELTKLGRDLAKLPWTRGSGGSCSQRRRRTA